MDILSGTQSVFLSLVISAFTSNYGPMCYNVLQLPEGGDFEALHCQPSRNFDRSTKLDLNTEPPLLGRCCWTKPKGSFMQPSLPFTTFRVLLIFNIKIMKKKPNPHWKSVWICKWFWKPLQQTPKSHCHFR